MFKRQYVPVSEVLLARARPISIGQAICAGQLRQLLQILVNILQYLLSYKNNVPFEKITKQTTDQDLQLEREGEGNVLEGKVIEECRKTFVKTMHKEVTKDDIRKVNGMFFVNMTSKTSKSIMA